METSPNLNLDVAPRFTYMQFSIYMLGWCYCNIFMCLTLVSIYISPWKIFMMFGIKKSHEMISYMLVEMTLLSTGICIIKWMEI
jgi:hypothetical protein